MQKRNIIRNTFLGSILLFQLVFLGYIICGSDVIAMPPHYLKPTSFEYWNWLVENRTSLDSALIDSATIISIVMTFIFLLGLSYDLFINPLRPKNKKPILISCVLGLIGYGIYFVYIRYFATHYYLPMIFIPTELLSIFALYVWRHSGADREKHKRLSENRDDADKKSLKGTIRMKNNATST